jgi:hypothetical protein
MKWALAAVCVASIQACSSEAAAPRTQQGSAVQLESADLEALASIELPHVEGRIDHMALDLDRDRLWLAALENGTLECVDVRTAQFAGRCTFPSEPQGVVIAGGRAWVSDGERGRLLVYARTDEHADEPPAASIEIGADADNLRCVPGTNTLVVGYGGGGLALVDSKAATVIARIPLDAHPESFQIAADGKRCWVNLPGARSIAVVDLEARRVVRSIRVDAARANYPMALVESERRLLVGCREPARLLVFDIDTDALVAELPLSADVDDIFADGERGLVYASCGAGFVDVFERASAGVWKPRSKIATAAGARTSLFVPERKRLFVAVPHRGTQRAEVRVFATGR